MNSMKQFLPAVLLLVAISIISKRSSAQVDTPEKIDLMKVPTTSLETETDPTEKAIMFRKVEKPWGQTKKKSPLLAAGLNWVLPGAGYLYTHQKPVGVSLGMMAGAAGLTYTELELQKKQPELYPIMFGSVLVLNTSLAIDTFIKVKKNNKKLEQ